jgi:phage FluMu gp28-like protein
MVAAAVPLYGFQKRWIADKSRFKIGNICRQSGKSFMVSLEVALDAAETGSLWVLLSAGERQSKELMEKVKMHLEAIKIACSSIEQDYFNDTEITMLTIRLPNGGRIIGLPANPDTARGFTGNVVLDEFAFHRDSDKIWKALFPTISRGFKLRIVSTPQGMGNRFHRIFSQANNWSKHFVDIYTAVADGVPHNIDELKAGIDDPDAWTQEYECQFVDEASSWLTYELIAACQDPKLHKEIVLEEFDLAAVMARWKPTGRVFGGYDVGRKRDLSIFWLSELLGDVFWSNLILVLPKTKFSIQRANMWAVMDAFKVERTCIDATGIGAQLAEDTVEKYGYRAEGVEFTNPVKKDIAVRTKNIYEDRLTRIPVCTVLRDDLHAVKKTVTAAGNIRFDAERTEQGHSDRFWGQGLSFMASNQGNVKPEIIIL